MPKRLLFTVPGNRKPSQPFHLLRWRTSQLLFLLLVLVAAMFYVFSPQQFELTTSLARFFRNNYKRNRCVNILREMRNAKWRPRHDLQSGDKQRRRELDIRIRKLRGLPTILHRDDMRCGNMFVLDSSAFGANIPAFCDPRSRAPCCNHKIGLCGSGEESCLCDRCVDFRNIVAAELNEFVPSSGCGFQNFTSKQACQLLSERVSSLSLIGDSLVRHFHNALLILFTDDRETGSLIKDLNKSDKELCSGEMQFVDGGKAVCHGKTAQSILQLSTGKFCQGQHKFLYCFHEFYNLAKADLALNEVRANLHKNNSVVAIGVGYHMGLNAAKVLNGYLKPILQLKEKERSHWPLIVWLTTHAHGSLKPVQYLPAQSNDVISRFNKDMRAFLEPVGVPVFDTFYLTLGVHSYDGTHYGIGVNMIKAQLFLNFLDETF